MSMFRMQFSVTQPHSEFNTYMFRNLLICLQLIKFGYKKQAKGLIVGNSIFTWVSISLRLPRIFA